MLTSSQFLSSTTAHSDPIEAGTVWTISPSLNMPKDASETLLKRYPTIQSASEMSKILVSANFKVPAAALRFERAADGTWVLTGHLAPKVTSISFELAPLSLLPSLRLAVATWVGQVHSEEIRQRVETEVTNFLQKNGYRSASAVVTAQDDDDQFSYNVKLNIGDPCVIKGYRWPEKMPDVSLKLVDAGELCMEAIAVSSVEDIERRIRAKGWVNANLEFAGFAYSDSDNTAFIKVGGSIGKKVIYQFVDGQTGEDIRFQLTTVDQQVLDPGSTNPESVSYELMKELRAQGYNDIQVTGPESSVVGDAETLVFKVSRGDAYHLGSLKFEGNDFFTDTELSSIMKISTVSSSDETKSQPIYNPDLVSSGVDQVRARYNQEGFWDIKVADRISPTTQSDRHSMQVAISIEEGPRRVFDHVEIHGSEAIDSSDLEDLWDGKKGSALDRAKVLDFQQKVREAYTNLGYFYANVKLELKSPPIAGSPIPITIHIDVDEGPRVKFGDVFVTGVLKTQAKVVTREVLFDTGDWYDPEAVSASRRALLRLGIFSSVVITPMDPSAIEQKSDIIDLLIDVKEAPSRSISFGPGWSNYYGMRYNLEGILSNINGTGRQLYSHANFNQERSQKAIGDRTLVGRVLSVGYLEPHILDSNLDGTVSLSQSARSTDYAWALTRGGEVEISHTLRTFVPGSKIAGFYGRKLNEEESNQAAADAFLADTFSVGRVGLRFNYDKRDDLSWPTSGYLLSSEASWARYELGGDLRYFRWEIGNNHYVSITNNFVFAIGANFSAYQGVTRKDESSVDILPASERLQSGGADSIRGYRERTLGPLVRRPNIDASGHWNCGYTTSPTGGSRRTLIKAEFRYRLTDSIATTLFTDSGNSSFSQEEAEKFKKAFAQPVTVAANPACPDAQPRLEIKDNTGYELADLMTHPGYVWTRHYTTAGLAMNFLTPIGSINLAYGVPWHEPLSDNCAANSDDCYPRAPQNIAWWRRGEFHFNVGAKF